MGVATALIGFLPTFASIGVLAPILLVTLRFMQGIGVGGEWGGAVLMAVEHAPPGKRGFYGSWPQMGVPAGLLTGTVAFLLATSSLPAWGWQVPFLFSFLLIVVGLFIRLRIMESPAFARVKESGTEARMPIIDVIHTYPKNVLPAMGMRLAENGTFSRHYGLLARLHNHGARFGAQHGPHRGNNRVRDRARHHPLLRGALGPLRASTGLPVRGGVLHPLRLPVLLTPQHGGDSPDLARHNPRFQHRPRCHVRPASGLLLRAFRHPCALLGGFAGIPARFGPCGRALAADRRGPSRRLWLRGGRDLHGRHGPRYGDLGPARRRDLPQ